MVEVTPPDRPSGQPRLRRSPPPFRRVSVKRIESLSPRLRRIVVGGEELGGMVIDEPAASVRLLVPSPGTEQLQMPEWTGNEFLLADGTRAPIRTFTPRYLDTENLELTLDVVSHDVGLATDWAASAAPGDEVAVSGPGRGFELDPDAESYLLIGDETAIPAISQLLESISATTSVETHIEISGPTCRVPLPEHPQSSVEWHVLAEGARPGSELVEAVVGLPELADHLWVAGEAAAMQKIRKHLFGERGLERSQATVRGYWKLGRSAT